MGSGEQRRGPAYFYPRPPRGGRRTIRRRCIPPQNISIHALRGEGDRGAGSDYILGGISIHALRGEGDLAFLAMFSGVFLFLSTPSAGRATSASRVSASGISSFLSTPSAGRATGGTGGAFPVFKISIHALRGEGD